MLHGLVRRVGMGGLLAFGLMLGAGEPAGAIQQAPTPESVIGFAPCADYSLATYEQIAEYFEALDAATDRMRLVAIGKTTEGRTQVMAVISSAENLRRLDRFQRISQRLAAAGGLGDTEARALATEGRAVVWIDFGLHSTEVGHAQAAPLVAHRVVTDESAEMQQVRDDVILLLVPNMNPDGTTLVADWYMRHVGTPHQDTSPPELYQRYAGHDNNRDWFMFNLAETRNVARQLYTEWLPQIVYNHHQSAPFPARIFVPPFADPMNPQIHPLVMRGVNLVGDAMTRRLDQEGKTGAISRLGFDTWWNGGMRTAPYFHNMIGILTETGHASATPTVHDPETFPKTFADGRPTLEPTTYYPNPYRGGPWHLRDTCRYMETTSLAVLELGAARREEWLYDIYRMGRDGIAAGEGEVYVVPADQWDRGAAIRLVNALRWGGVAVERLIQPTRVGARTYPAESHVIRGAQPFRPYITDLLTPQRYPDRRQYPDGPPLRPYDITGWTLPLQMGVTVDRHTGIDDLAANRLQAIGRAALGQSRVPDGNATVFGYALDPRVNQTFTAANRLLAGGQPLHRATDTLSLGGGATWPPGAFVVPAEAETRARLARAAADLGLTIAALDRRPTTPLAPVDPPRVALYRGWGANPDEGWTRWLLERFAFAYETLRDADLRANRLDHYDVVVLPDASYDRMLTGLSSSAAPPAYTGGMTPRGVSHLFDFVDRGGTLVALDSASELPVVGFGLPVEDLTRRRSDSELFVPGTLLALQVDPTHPIGYGMPARATAFVSRSPVFRPSGDHATEGEVAVVARYPTDDLLQSGWLIGERWLADQAAVVEIAVGRGRVVLLGLRAQHRGQTDGTFKLLFNALYLASTAAAGETAAR